jgi:hypothetical protein
MSVSPLLAATWSNNDVRAIDTDLAQSYRVINYFVYLFL